MLWDKNYKKKSYINLVWNIKEEASNCQLTFQSVEESFKVDWVEDWQKSICTCYSFCLVLFPQISSGLLPYFFKSLLKVNMSKRSFLTTLPKIAVLTPHSPGPYSALFFFLAFITTWYYIYILRLLAISNPLESESYKDWDFVSLGSPAARNVPGSQEAFNIDLVNEQTMLSIQFKK